MVECLVGVCGGVGFFLSVVGRSASLSVCVRVCVPE